MEVFDIRGIGSKNHKEKHGKSVNLKLDTLEISIDKLFSIRDSLSQHIPTIVSGELTIICPVAFSCPASTSLASVE